VPTIEINQTNFRRLMSLVNPLFSVDEALERLLDNAGVPPMESTSETVPAVSSGDSMTAHPSSPSDRPSHTDPGTADRRTAGPRSHGAPPAERAARGSSLPQERYRRAILVELELAGGEGKSRDIQQCVYKRLAPEMTDIDLAPLPKNKREPRWQNHSRFAREYLVKNGYLKRDSPWGTWELTTKGSQMAGKLLVDFDRSDISLN